jgi:predicted transcriptional regulator
MVQTIPVPNDLFERLQRTAEALHAPLEEVARKALTAGLPPGVEDVPPEFRADVEELDRYTDEALWTVWRSVLSAEHDARHDALLALSGDRELTDMEQAELAELREEADRLLLRRAQAGALLRWRGHAVPINQ